MLSHGVSLISFDKAEEIISAAVIKSSDYYYGDGSDYVTVTLNMTVQKSNYEFSDYVQGWLWDDRQMNVTIYKNTYYLDEDYKKLTLLDDFQLDPNTKNYEFDIDIGETFGGFGIYVFNVSLIVKDNNGDYRIVDEYEIQKSIWINISDVDIIDISPNVMPIDTDNNLLTVKIQNIGNITQKFDVYVYDENILSKKWLSALPLPAYTLKETIRWINYK